MTLLLKKSAETATSTQNNLTMTLMQSVGIWKKSRDSLGERLFPFHQKKQRHALGVFLRVDIFRPVKAVAAKEP